MNRHEHPNPDEFHAVEARLRESRAHADAFELDQIKQRVMTRSGAQPRRAVFMTSRIASFASVVVLGVGTSGAIALAGHTSSHGPTGGAADSQYWPGKGCGDRNHDRPLPTTGNPCPQSGGVASGVDHGHGRGDNGQSQPTGGGKDH